MNAPARLELPRTSDGYTPELLISLQGGWHRGNVRDPLIRFDLREGNKVEGTTVLPVYTLFDVFPLMRAALLLRGIDR